MLCACITHATPAVNLPAPESSASAMDSRMADSPESTESKNSSLLDSPVLDSNARESNITGLPESSLPFLRQPPRFYAANTHAMPDRVAARELGEMRDEFDDMARQTLPQDSASTHDLANPSSPTSAHSIAESNPHNGKSPQLHKPLSALERAEPIPTYYKPDSPSTYLNTTIGLLGGGIVVSIIGLYLMPESVTNWDRSRFGFQAWLQDVQIGPVIDSDNFMLNGVAHPYFGAVYYMQPRVAGYSWAESALFAFVTSSIFWEYGIEAFVEIPSWQDLIYTPAMGSIFGELFYQATTYIQSHDNRLFGSRVLGLIVVGLMDPIGVIMRDFGLARAMGVNDMRQVVSYATPLKVGFAMRF